MPKWEAGIINKSVNYRTASASSSGGVWSLEDHLRHSNAGNLFANPALDVDTGYQFSNLTIIETLVSGDNTDAYSVATVAMPSSASQGRVYLAVQITASTTFYNDFCIGAVQIPHSSGAALNTTGDVSTNVDWGMDAHATDWERGNIFVGSNATLSSVSGYTWASITASATANRWNKATGTGSQRTGAQGGLSEGTGYNIFSELGDLAVTGNSATREAQDNAANYIYVESSGMTLGEIVWCRSPEVTLTGANHVLLIAYHACTSSGGIGMVNTSDKPLLRAFWDES